MSANHLPCIAMATFALGASLCQADQFGDPRAPLPALAHEGATPGSCHIGFQSFLGVSYQLQASDNLTGWADLGAPIRGNNKWIDCPGTGPGGAAGFYRIAWSAPDLPILPPLATFCAIGDSITDRATFAQPAGYDALGYDQSGWAAILEQYSGRRLQSVARNNAFKKDRDHGYSGITAWMFFNGGGWLPAGLVPINDAIASNPDCFIVHIGTNDIAGSSSASIISQIHGIWDRLVATGKPVIGTDILNRSAAYPGWNSGYRDRVNEVNAAMRATWQSRGLVSYRPWDDLIEKDAQGFAAVAEFPNDYIHPTMRVGLKLGKDLHQVLSGSYAGSPPAVPAGGAPAWLTPNPQVEGEGNLAPSWNSYAMGVVGTDVIYSKTKDAEGVWQKVSVINPQPSGTRGVYSRQISAGTTWRVGDRCMATLRIRVPDGTNFSGIGINIQCVGASAPWIDVAGVVNTSNPSPIEAYDTVIVSDPFTVPADTTQLWFLVRVVGGAGTFEFRQAGVFRVSP